MNKLTIIAGLAAVVVAGPALAQTAAPAAPQSPSAGAPPPPGGPDGRFERWRGGPGGPGGMRMRMRMHRPSLEEVQKRNADAFARMDANRDGRVTFEEFRGDMERRRTERQHRMFERFSGGRDSVTLSELNDRAKQRLERRGPPPPAQEPRPGR